VASLTPERSIPFDELGLAGLTGNVRQSLIDGLRRVGEALTLLFGEEPAQAAMGVLLVETMYGATDTRDVDRDGWRAFLEKESELSDPSGYDEPTQLWYDGAAYAGQGIVPLEYISSASLQEREGGIRTLIAKSAIALDCTSTILGHEYDFIWKGVAARAAIDFGGFVSIEGLQLLSGLSLAVVRNAVSSGDLHPDKNGNVSSQDAQAWLARRRGFCPSRWKDLTDWQEPFRPDRVATPDQQGMIGVPRAAEGEVFLPEHVVRSARNKQGLSITVGAKGQEVQFHDFYDALRELAQMDVPRWRRRNSAGNWGIVRARGAWIAVSKAEIDRQLAKKLAEAS